VFIALQRLGSGSAREVAEATDVPRSQVYSAAESLADRGLVGVQQSTPMRYRPVSVDAAEATLRERFEHERDRAFEYVGQVRAEDAESREEVWTLRGTGAIDERVAELVGGADHRVTLGVRLPELLGEDLLDRLADRAGAGAAVTVVSESDAVRDRLPPAVETVAPPARLAGDDRSGRVLSVDDDTVLLSVVDEAGDETAIWSSGPGFADVLGDLLEVGMGV
jgi:sugar-specific transcriptional regulator TrmB